MRDLRSRWLAAPANHVELEGTEAGLSQLGIVVDLGTKARSPASVIGQRIRAASLYAKSMDSRLLGNEGNSARRYAHLAGGDIEAAAERFGAAMARAMALECPLPARLSRASIDGATTKR